MPLEIVHRAAPCCNVPVTFTTRASLPVKQIVASIAQGYRIGFVVGDVLTL